MLRHRWPGVIVMMDLALLICHCSLSNHPEKNSARPGVSPSSRLSSVTRLPVRAVRGAVTQLNSWLVRQQCTMSGRTATWR
eukprot:3864989-Prymnesium_polylepis.1